MVFGRDRLRNESFLRFVLPLAPAAEAAEAVVESAVPLYQDGRPEFSDFDLFQTRPFQGDTTTNRWPRPTPCSTPRPPASTPRRATRSLQIGATRIVNGRLLRGGPFGS